MAYGYDENNNGTSDGDKMKMLVTGLVVGGLIGAAVMLFLAPQSGKKTRARLRKQTMKLADRTRDTVDDTLEDARDRFDRVTSGVRKRANKVQDRGQDLLEQQKERVSEIVSSGRKRMRMPGR